MRKVLILMLAGALLLSVTGAAQAGKKKKKKKKAPVEMVMFTDDSGDADVQQGVGASIPAGVDLTEGKIKKVDDTLEFTVTHADMPPSGSLPEAARFLWGFSVDGANFRLTVKSADIGKPDVLAGQTTERVGRADVNGHFRLEGECASEVVGALNAVNCPPLAYLEGTFDPASMTFTMVVPLEEIEAKSGSKIGPAGGNNTGICSICWVSHTAERSLDATIIDSASAGETYRVP
ncbi:MAG: hypothetical protein ACR2KQ_00135 [Actinomycetota bacterium]